MSQSQSQGSVIPPPGGGGGGGIDQSQYPNYDDDVATFQSFLSEHTILQLAADNNNNNNNNTNNNILYEPSADGITNVIRVPCYLPILQRIINRNYYNENSTTFIIEIPLQELVIWDSIRGMDLAQRASINTLRYISLFSNVIDTTLKALQSTITTNTTTNSNSNSNETGTNNNHHLRDTIDILQEQREQQMALHQQQRQQQQGGGNDGTGDVIGGGNGILNDDANNNNNGNATAGDGAIEAFPPTLMRRYELRILPLGRPGTVEPFHQQYRTNKTYPSIRNNNNNNSNGGNGVSLRHVRSKSMGRLVTIRGMVVRSSDVKPFCQVATYSCDLCGCEVYDEISTKREFMPRRLCPSPTCINRPGRLKDTLHLQTRGSKFIKFQELKLQELPSQVPMGHVPRSMSVYCRGELTRLAVPGDVITIDGIFLPQRVGEGQGYKGMMRAGLMTTTYLEAQHIVVHKRSYDESSLDNNTSSSEEESIQLDKDIVSIATSDDPIGILSSNIAPEIFGHEDIKRSLLLQLVGGCCRTLPDGMRIRGDINICLMGDPGVAKSQLLKHVATIAPRGVYTTGKGSSGVGLTAAVTKDTISGEMTLEGGALVLADRGICAIDEFDKMDEADRTAIHEVMEQQTVSIAKAGIVATLNARAAVLAAANPLYSRYNRHKSLSENVNLPNSLLSRFDLMFLILDIADVDRDIALARHVTYVHKYEGFDNKNNDDDTDNDTDNENDDNDNNDNDDDRSMNSNSSSNNRQYGKNLPPKLLREYIARARKHQPIVPKEVAPYIVEAYVSLRLQDRPGGGNNSSFRRKNRLNSNNKVGSSSSDQTVMTARQLLSILRLSQALARLRFSDFVAREDVDEAIRLTHMSKATLYNNDPNNNNNNSNGNNSSSGMGQNGGGGTNRREDVMSRIFNTIRDYATSSSSSSLDLKLCEAMVIRKGFTVQQLQSCLEEYESLEIIQVNRNRTKIHFVT